MISSGAVDTDILFPLTLNHTSLDQQLLSVGLHLFGLFTRSYFNCLINRFAQYACKPSYLRNWPVRKISESAVYLLFIGGCSSGLSKAFSFPKQAPAEPVAPSDRQSIVRLVRRESVEHFLHQSPRTGEAEAVVVV